MARITQNRSWLEMHSGTWRVTVAVPKALRAKMGTRLKRSLRTDSLAIANQRKLRVVDEFHALIGRELQMLGVLPRSNYVDALALRDQLKEADSEFAVDDALREIAAVATDILGPETAVKYDTETGIPELKYDPKREAKADEFLGIVRGTATPLKLHHDAYLEKTQVKARTKGDDVRAIKYLSDWCSTKHHSASLEAITRKVATNFMDDLGALTGHLASATQNKYLNRLSRYWQYLLKREIVTSNVWAGLRVVGKSKAHDEEERAFTDVEIQRLLTGGAPPKLLDLIKIAALSGARLDAVVDLKVKDIADGIFTFKPQKRERTPRDIPIHRDLNEIVLRRTAGKWPDEDLFPEWPKPKKAGSTRERSFKASNAFTKYRRMCGVDQKVEGLRRSLVNFHSLRRWFITKAERARFSGDLIAAIVGHKRSGMTLGRYSEGPEMRTARKCVNAVRLPALDGTLVREDRSLTPRSRPTKS